MWRHMVASVCVLWIVTGCCAVRGLMLRVESTPADGNLVSNSLPALVGGVLEPLGFSTPSTTPPDRVITSFSIRTASVPANQIDVVVDREAQTVRLVDFQLGGSPIFRQVKEVLEQRINDAYHLEAQFQALSCGWLGP